MAVPESSSSSTVDVSQRPKNLLVPHYQVEAVGIISDDDSGHRSGGKVPQSEDDYVQADRTINALSIPRARKFFRNIGAESLYILFRELRGDEFPEKEKVVIISDFRTACLTSVLHILPVATSLFLVAFNMRGYYIGKELVGPSGQDDLKFLGIQLASKLHELLAMASLSCILFALIRKQLLRGNLPFGALTAGLEFKGLSILWSKEFMATCSAKFQNKILLLTTIIVFTILGATVGPSAATTAKPVLQNWSAGGTIFYLNDTYQNIWPRSLETPQTSELSCTPSASNGSCFPSNSKLLADGLFSYWPSHDAGAKEYYFPNLLPEQFRVGGRQSLRNMASRFRGPFVYNPPVTSATVPMAIIADVLGNLAKYWTIANNYRCAKDKRWGFCWYNDIIFSLETPQPMTFVSCRVNQKNTTLGFWKIDDGLTNFPVVNLTNSTFASTEWYNNVTENATTTSLPTWIELPTKEFGSNSIGAVVALPKSNITGVNTTGEVMACTIDARWQNVTSNLTFLNGPLLVNGFNQEWFFIERYLNASNGGFLWPQILISPKWAKQFDADFINLADSVARAGNIANVPSPVNAVEAVLAVMLADAIARIGNTATIKGGLKGTKNDPADWISDIMPTKTIYGEGDSAFNYTFNVGDSVMKLQMRAQVNGLGYGMSAATILASCALLLYSIIAIIYVIHELCFFSANSNTWESISELLTLAVNSTPTSALHNTGAGVDTLKPFQQPIHIGVSQRRLQIVFDGEDDVYGEKQDFEPVINGKLYG